MSVNNRLERCYPSDYDYSASTRSYNSPVITQSMNAPIMNPTGSVEPESWNLSSPPNGIPSKSILLDSHDRCKPEKFQRRPVQKMKWGNNQARWSRTIAGDLFSCSYSNTISPDGYSNNFAPLKMPPIHLESESRVSSMTIADMSPRIAVKKVLLLYEHAQYREAASFINRLSIGTFRIILRELPIDVFVEAMPHSLPIMEALYVKVYTSDGHGVNLKPLKPESVIMHMVKFFSREDSAQGRLRRETMGPFTIGCRKILEVIVVGEPKIMKTIMQRQKALNKAVEGMGQHGLVGTTDESLLPLHDALKLEFRRVVDTYKGALQKLEDLALSNRSNPKSVAHGPAPVSASHQRQLSLRAEEIQDRLIKNKSLLNVVEPTLDNNCLDILLGILQRRIQCDKESLFQFTQLRKEAGDVTADAIVAPLLMRYSRGCKQVLELMREVAKEVGRDAEDYDDDSSDLSGYHSDSDSAIMTSGNSPYVSPKARYNFLSRSGRCKAILRPSLLSATSSGPSSVSSNSRAGFTEGSVGGGAPSPGGADFNCESSTSSQSPTRPRHIKLRNQLHKNNSVASTSSSVGSETCSSGSSNASVKNEDYEQGLLPDGQDCMECVTLVSVPDDQVITQGINHHCSISKASGNRIGDSVVDHGSSPPSRLVADLRDEIALLRHQLEMAKEAIRNNNNKFESKNTDGSRFVGGGGGSLSTAVINNNNGNNTESSLIREYGALYAQARVVAMDDLDALEQLGTADELKSKLLFSVVILAFRSVHRQAGEIKEQVQSALQLRDFSSVWSSDGMDSGNHGCSSPTQLDQETVGAIANYLRHSGNRFNLARCVQQVANQLWATLYDYPCLKTCDGLLRYIQSCVNVAWGLSNLTPPCVLEFETREFLREMHVRFHSSDQDSNVVKTYLWPALVRAHDGTCLHKGVVIT